MVAAGIRRAIEGRAVGPGLAANVVAGRQGIGVKIDRRRQQVAELHRLVAHDAGDRRFPAEIRIRKTVHHAFAEPAFVVQDVVRNAQRLGDAPGVMDILPGATGTLALYRGAMVVKLQRDPDDVVTGLGQKRGGDRAVHAPGHGDDHPGILRAFLDIQRVHGGEYRSNPATCNASGTYGANVSPISQNWTSSRVA